MTKNWLMKFLICVFLFICHRQGSAQTQRSSEIEKLNALREGKSHLQVDLSYPTDYDRIPRRVNTEEFEAEVKNLERFRLMVYLEKSILAESDEEVRELKKLNERNLTLRQEILRCENHSRFKDEFETTSQFNERKKRLEQQAEEHRLELDKVNSLLKSTTNQDAAERLRSRGTPVRLKVQTKDVFYNADEGILRWRIYLNYSCWTGPPGGGDRPPEAIDCNLASYSYFKFHIPDAEKARAVKQAITTSAVLVGTASTDLPVWQRKTNTKLNLEMNTKTFAIVLHNLDNIEFNDVLDLKSMDIEWAFETSRF